MIAERIKQLREQNALTQSALAKQLGITRSSVNAWEMGISVPSTQYLVELAEIFRVSTDYLLGVALNILPLIGSAIQEAVYHINSRIETSVPEEPATPVGDSEDYAFGVLYWYAEDPVSDETADALDDIVLDYNLDHDLPDMESASDYLLPLLEDLPISDWSLEQEDNDICLLVTPE